SDLRFGRPVPVDLRGPIDATGAQHILPALAALLRFLPGLLARGVPYRLVAEFHEVSHREAGDRVLVDGERCVLPETRVLAADRGHPGHARAHRGGFQRYRNPDDDPFSPLLLEPRSEERRVGTVGS